VLAFVILGLAARCVRYFLRFPLWEDECFLCVNLIDRDFRGLMQPLNYHQVAPLLFLWMQLAVVKLFGFNEMSLRLVPFLAGLGNIVLFWRLACRCLDGVPRLLAVAVFSVTYATIRYSAEAKPYGVDLFVALVLITLAVNWLLAVKVAAASRTAAEAPGAPSGHGHFRCRSARGSYWLWALAAAIPLAVGMSYGAIMLGGGLWLTVAYVIWRQRRWESVLAWAAYSAALLAAFAALYFVSIRGQEAHDLEAMREMWQEHFPPLTGVADFAFWMVHTHTGDILAYPAGGSPFQSSLATVCWLAALVTLVRRRQGAFLVLCLAPLAVTFVAALLRRFPYGGHIRLNLYMAPLMCMLIGYGLTVVGKGWVRFGLRPRLSLMATLLLLALVGVVTIARDLTGPYKTISDQQNRAFAEWFWASAEHGGEAACVKTDLGLDFSPDAYRHLCFAAEYLCNQRIYSPRRAAGQPIHWDRITADHPLRCVLYRAPSYCFNEYGLETWLVEMQEKYELVSRDRIPLVRVKNTGSLLCVDYLEIFSFIPRRTESAPAERTRPVIPSTAP
jgi:hypothetical protein